MVLATPGHLPGFCRFELQFSPFHGEHCSQHTISTPSLGSCTTSFYSCYLYSETTKTRRTKEQIFLRVGKEQSAYPMSRYYQRIIRTRLGSPGALWEIIIKPVWSQSPGCLHRKMQQINHRSFPFLWKNVGWCWVRGRMRESTKRGEKRDQKERAGRKGMSDRDGHGARSCCSFRHRMLQRGQACPTPTSAWSVWVCSQDNGNGQRYE